MTIISFETPFTAVYGPVESWRFRRSLGIDPIGPVSSCSFSCVYCQLGEIEQPCHDRQIFVPTQQIQRELATCEPWDDVDVISVSGSGEPTLALNLGEILEMIHTTTGKQIAVLTNGSFLHDANVRADLAIADYVLVKLDAIEPDGLRRINRPMSEVNASQHWMGLQKFRQMYQGKLSIQTMLLQAWDEAKQDQYIAHMQTLGPDEIQLNTPTRPRPLKHQIDARENYDWNDLGYPVTTLKPVSPEVLEQFGDRIRSRTGIPVRYPLSLLQHHSQA